jgi:hypothetical protein
MSQELQLLPPSVIHPYTGGHTMLYGGYVFELCPAHPKANPFGFVPQHRLIVERSLGRYLLPDEHVHHKDFSKSNNDPANLEVRLHREHKHGMRKLAPLDEASVRAALQEKRLLVVAKQFGVHTQTIRNRFPDLVRQYQRRSPTKPTDPDVVVRILELARDPAMGYREVARLTGTSFDCVRGICRTHGVVWSPKSKGRKGQRKVLGRNAMRRTPQGFYAIESEPADQ